MRTTAARSGDVATRRTHFPLLSFGLAIALLASWLFFGAVLLNFPAAQHNACGSVWNSSSPAADGEDSSRIARTPLRARRRLAQSKPSEATEGPLRVAARLVEETRAAERNATLAREVPPTSRMRPQAHSRRRHKGVLECTVVRKACLSVHSPQPECSKTCRQRPFSLKLHGADAAVDAMAVRKERAMLKDPLNAFQLRHLEQDIAPAAEGEPPDGPYEQGPPPIMIWPEFESGFGDSLLKRRVLSSRRPKRPRPKGPPPA